MEINSVSAAVLAGGFSSRMGRDKAGLELNGKKLIEIQVEKLRELGIGDIMLSGYSGELPGTRTVPDVYSHLGPLSGVHACLDAAKCTACLFISVDVPLILAETLEALVAAHNGGVTVLTHSGKTEPLMAVYDKALCIQAEETLNSGRTAMMRFLSSCPVTEHEYSGDPGLLSNCNTPEEFNMLKQL